MPFYISQPWKLRAIGIDNEGTDKGNAYKITKELKSYDEDNKLTVDYSLVMVRLMQRVCVSVAI